MKDGEPAPSALAHVDLVASLLKRMEADDLDFKRNQYPLEPDKDKSKFVKDIVAPANTPRSGAAYILVGVDEEGGQVRSIVGCDDHLDPAKLSNLVSGHMDEYPRFSYRVVEYEGKMLGLIEIRRQTHGAVESKS